MGNRQLPGQWAICIALLPAAWAIGNGSWTVGKRQAHNIRLIKAEATNSYYILLLVHDIHLEEKNNFRRQPSVDICCSGHDNDEQVTITIRSPQS